MNNAQYIRLCLELAERGRGKVKTNPLVGCVIVGKTGEIILEGWHEEFGDVHAEVHAIENAQRKSGGRRAVGDILYVNLEPCCHTGKQPPCTDAILRSGIKRVIFGARDPVNGGSEVLKSRGIEVIGLVMEAECRRFNKGFFSLIENGRPWVTIKKALRLDGSVPSDHITSEEQDAWTHTRLRATHDAILVGVGTVIADNPKLSMRHQLPTANRQSPIANRQPRRIILDPHNQIPPTARVITDSDAARTLVIREKLPISELLERLKEEGIASVLVEGGPSVWEAFEESGCIDEIVTLTQRLSTSELQNL